MLWYDHTDVCVYLHFWWLHDNILIYFHGLNFNCCTLILQGGSWSEWLWSVREMVRFSNQLWEWSDLPPTGWALAMHGLKRHTCVFPCFPHHWMVNTENRPKKSSWSRAGPELVELPPAAWPLMTFGVTRCFHIHCSKASARFHHEKCG